MALNEHDIRALLRQNEERREEREREMASNELESAVSVAARIAGYVTWDGAQIIADDRMRVAAAAAKEAARRMKERCAAVCKVVGDGPRWSAEGVEATEDCAAAIRALEDEP